MQVTLETGAIKELSEQSNCSILQGTKVGSAKEYDQVRINSPESGSTKQYILLQAELINIKEIEYPPVDFNTSSAAYILNKHPRQSRPKDCSPAVHQTFKGITSPAVQNSPEEPNPVSPGKLEFISPNSKLIPSRFWKLISSQNTNTSSGLI